MTKKELLNDSGIKTEDGRDVLTEITGQEFKEWVRQYRINIGIVSHDVLDGFDAHTNDYQEYRKYLARVRYIVFVELNTTITIPKDEKRWRDFLESLEEYL